jgi:AraC family transcriptional regulator
MAGNQSVHKMTGRGLAPWQAELAQRLLLEDVCADRSMERVAAHCGLSRSYFEKAFKASLGTPPHQWLVRQRVQRAADMLERTNDSIGAIALNCGFTDQSHLTRVFRANVGFSPAAWRRQRKAGLAPPLARALEIGAPGFAALKSRLGDLP